MQTGVELQEPFSYSLIPIILLFLILFLPFIIRLFKKYFIKNNSNYVVNNYSDLNVIKLKYLNKLDELERMLDSNDITNRKAFQELSLLIRSFIKEISGLDVTTCVLSDIRKMNIPVVYELIEEYYSPEFAKISKGNIRSSISKTRGVIYRWN